MLRHCMLVRMFDVFVPFAPCHTPQRRLKVNGTEVDVCRVCFGIYHHRADSRFTLSQWETALLCNDVSHWLGINVESALHHICWVDGDRDVEFVFITLRPRQNGSHFAADIFKCIFLNENVWISLMISLKFIAKVWINNIPSYVQRMDWCWPGNKPLSETMIVSLLTHICITWPQWVYSKLSWKV